MLRMLKARFNLILFPLFILLLLITVGFYKKGTISIKNEPVIYAGKDIGNLPSTIA